METKVGGDVSENAVSDSYKIGQTTRWDNRTTKSDQDPRCQGCLERTETVMQLILRRDGKQTGREQCDKSKGRR